VRYSNSRSPSCEFRTDRSPDTIAALSLQFRVERIEQLHLFGERTDRRRRTVQRTPLSEHSSSTGPTGNALRVRFRRSSGSSAIRLVRPLGELTFVRRPALRATTLGSCPVRWSHADSERLRIRILSFIRELANVVDVIYRSTRRIQDNQCVPAPTTPRFRARGVDRSNQDDEMMLSMRCRTLGTAPSRTTWAACVVRI